MRCVHHADGVEHRSQPRAHFGLVLRLAGLCEHALQARPFMVRHHHVGGAVVFPEAIDLDERGVIEAREHSRFGDEGSQTGRVGSAGVAGLRLDIRRASHAPAQRARQIFLQRDPAAQRMIPGEVDDAETGFADQAANLVVAQLRAGRQCLIPFHESRHGFPVRGLFPFGRVVAFSSRTHHGYSRQSDGAFCCRAAGRAAQPRKAAIVAPRPRLVRGCNRRASDIPHRASLALRFAPAARPDGPCQARSGSAASGAGRRRNMPQPCIDSTTSSCWFFTSQFDLMRPTVGRLAIGRASSTVRRTLSVSPG